MEWIAGYGKQMKGKYQMNPDRDRVRSDQPIDKLMKNAVLENIYILSAMMDSIPVASLMIDSNDRVVIWNRACEVLTGIPREEVLNQPLKSGLFHIDDHKHLQNRVSDRIQSDSATGLRVSCCACAP